MINNFFLFLFSSIFFAASAQIQQGGIPYSTLHGLPSLVENTISFPKVDLQKLAAEDAIYDLQKDIPYRFGFNFEGNYNSSNAGEWTNLPNGDRLWRINFYSAGAQTLNFLLQNYNLAEGANIFIYNEDKSAVLGSFDHNNNRAHKNLSTFPMPGSTATIEFYEPKSARGKSSFEITRVTHGYRSIKLATKAVNESGPCNNNVICAVGNDWRDQIKSVGIIIVNGNDHCTGNLINNTCEDKKPYFLTANHCTGSDVATWTVGFNFESTDCSTNTGFNTNIFQSVNVLAIRAQNANTDMALLELVQTPPVQFNVFFAGWDRSGNLPTSQVGIHHPAGDLKKISFDNDPAVQSFYSGAPSWRVIDWEDGTTEGGSSGSALFDQNKRIIGQLFGGSASCSVDGSDYYGRFDISWAGGTNPNDELQSWLDPLQTNVMTLDGLDGSTISSDDITIAFLNKPDIVNCGVNIAQQILLTNNGSNTANSISFNYGLDGNIQTYTWNGSLATDQSITISFDALQLCDGNYNYTLEITNYNAGIDDIICNNADHFSFEAINGSKLEVLVKTNLSGDETSFDILDSNQNIIYTENNFNNNRNHFFEYCLPLGNYSFKMKDSGNNGLSSTLGNFNGFYVLKLDGLEIQNNGTFGAEENTPISAVANGLNADFDLEDIFTSTPIDLLNNSSGFVTNLLWEAPEANPNTGQNQQFTTMYSTPGTYIIKLTVSNDSACTVAEKTITVKSGVAIENQFKASDISIYPNPASEYIIVEKQVKEELSLSIKNYLGKEVYRALLKNKESKINTASFSKGIYFIELKNENKKSIFKLLLN